MELHKIDSWKVKTKDRQNALRSADECAERRSRPDDTVF
jgi:hypothetical protein